MGRPPRRPRKAGKELAHPHRRAIFAQATDLHGKRGKFAGLKPPDLPEYALAILRMHQGNEVDTPEFLFLVAQQVAERGVGLQKMSRRIEDGDSRRRVLEHIAKDRLAAAQFFLHALALGDVLVGHDDAVVVEA